MLKRWGRSTFRVLITGLIGLALTAEAFASPDLINFQGRLTDSGGTPVTTTATLTVRIFSTETGGTADWSETHPSVAVQDGMYNVLLGSVQPFPADLFLNDARWFEVEVNGEILTPRQRMTSVAYALEADHAGSADVAATVTGGGVTTTMIQMPLSTMQNSPQVRSPAARSQTSQSRKKRSPTAQSRAPRLQTGPAPD